MDICPWLNTGKTKLSLCAKLSETQTSGTLPALIPHLGQFPGDRLGANEQTHHSLEGPAKRVNVM